MESLWRHILKSIFDEFVDGLDDNIDCSKSMVELWDLQLKREKIQDIYGDCHRSPVEFSDGKIGSMQMKMSWLGNIEISATNVVLNLNFTPFKAMKNAIMPGAELQEGFVHRVPDDLRRAEHWRSLFCCSGSGEKTTPPVLPRYCRAHGTKARRKKGEARDEQCSRCKVRLLTNYVECSLCIPCSVRESQCLICAASLPNSSHPDANSGKSEGFVFTVAEMRHPDYMASIQTGAPLPYQVPPKFCMFHRRPDRQKIGEVRNSQCLHCKARLQTNFEEVSLCTSCSSKENKCLLCAAYMPPPPAGSGFGVPTNGLPTRNGLPTNVERLDLEAIKTNGEAGIAHHASDDQQPWRNMSAGLDAAQAVQNRHLMSDPLPVRRHASSNDSQSHTGKQDRQDGDVQQVPKDALSTPEHTPRKERSESPPHRTDDLEVPLEESKRRIDTKKTPNQEGGASRPKMLSGLRGRWQHHFHHSHSEVDFDHALVPPPPAEEPAPAKQEARGSQGHAGGGKPDHKPSLVKSASSSVAHAAGKIGGLFGFGHHSDKDTGANHDTHDVKNHSVPEHEEAGLLTPKSSRSEDSPKQSRNNSREHEQIQSRSESRQNDPVFGSFESAERRNAD